MTFIDAVIAANTTPFKETEDNRQSLQSLKDAINKTHIANTSMIYIMKYLQTTKLALIRDKEFLNPKLMPSQN